MSIYEGFTDFYVRGIWPEFSRKMAEILPGVLKRLEASPKSILDVACGEGTFAVAQAKAGYKITGIDASSRMLKKAQEKALKENLDIRFILRDMRKLAFNEEFDLATCWFDSLNYLLETSDLEKTFAGVWHSLKAGGLFIFDMNTVYGLISYSGVAVKYQKGFSFIQLSTPDAVVLNYPEYDFGTNIATWQFTCFMREGDIWHRIDEIHCERGYSLEEIESCFKKAGFTELYRTGDLSNMEELKPESKRVWFVLRK